MQPTPTKSTVETWKKVVEIEISADKMRAIARILDPSLPLKELASRLKSEMKIKGVRRGIIKENIEKLLRDKDPTQRLIIARGTPAQTGFKGKVIPLANFDVRPEIALEKIAEEHIQTLKHPNLVFTNTPLLRLSPGKKSQPGFTVTGKSLSPKKQIDDPDPIITLGKHVTYSKDDPNLIVSITDGLAQFSKDGDTYFVDVEPVHIIRGDARSYLYNGKRFDGTVIITGDVQAGARITASEDIEVYGTVEDAQLEAERDIIIYHGFVGRGRGLVKAGRNVILSFALHQNLEAGDSILFYKEMMGTSCKAGGKILSVKGGIIGGRAEALEKISIKFAGSEEAVKTDLMVGNWKPLNLRKLEVEEEIKALQKKLEEGKKRLYELIRRQIDKKTTPEEDEELLRLQDEKKQLPEEIAELESELESLNNAIQKGKNAIIEISGTIYERVGIYISDANMMMTRKKVRKRFRLLGDSIDMTTG